MTLLLVDGLNILMRAAFGGDVEPDRSTPIACGIIERAVRRLNVTHLVIALDYPDAPSWRAIEYPEYKANRTRNTSAWLVEGAVAFHRQRWHCEVAAGFEADDIIATLALRAAAHADVEVLSNDSDLLALTVQPNITIARPKGGGELEHLAAPDVCERYQLPDPSALADFKAMVGEKGDNVPGVPGIGEKRAAAMLRSFNDLETIIRAGEGGYNADTAKVAAHAEAARLALKLVSLRTDVPIAPINPRTCAVQRVA